jgi:hypothetical protein
VLGWLRWAIANEVAGFPTDLKRIDLALNSLDLLMHENVDYADGKRADTLRELLQL